MLDEKLLTSLENSLRKARKDQQRLIRERASIRAIGGAGNPDDERMTREIDALENSAKQTETVIYSLLATMRKNKG